MQLPDILKVNQLLTWYRLKKITPAEVILTIRERIAQHKDNPIWITVLSDEELSPYLERLSQQNPNLLPLYGIPFALKDNIDLGSIPTTCACKPFSYTPTYSAQVVDFLVQAGAIPIGKTNLDQFATGLVGTRSPYGAVKNALNPDYISGGSSSGSAVAVALGQVSFALGTDTAGSGRVPAALNHLVGIKPTCGLVSTHGVFPACKTLDCVSVFTIDMDDAGLIMPIISQYDNKDAFARPKPGHLHSQTAEVIAIPDNIETFVYPETETYFQQVVAHAKSLGFIIKKIDLSPFLEAAKLLYEGPWVAERTAALGDFALDALHPVTQAIITKGKDYSAMDTFNAIYKLEILKQQIDLFWQEMDVLMTPTIPRPYTLKEVEMDPFITNSHLGYYTNFMNLLDMTAIALPMGYDRQGIGFGITVSAPAWKDDKLMVLAQELLFEEISVGKDNMLLAVAGAHLTGLALNQQLLDLGGNWHQTTFTSSDYKLYALPDGKRPALVKDACGSSIMLELWSLPKASIGEFLAKIAPPLGLGTVDLIDGRQVKGFIAEPQAVTHAQDITALGSWRNYLRKHKV